VQVIAAIAAVIVAVAAAEIVKWSLYRRDLAASALLFDALSLDDKGGETAKATTEEMLAAYRKVISESPSSDAAMLAGLEVAALSLGSGNDAAALGGADKYLKDSPSADRLRFAAMEIKGYALLNKGEYKAAAEIFLSMAESKNAVGKDYALYDLGFALKKAGDAKGAAAAFRRIAAEAPASQLKDKANALAAELDPQGQAPAAEAP
jgi:hypothetical protein